MTKNLQNRINANKKRATELLPLFVAGLKTRLAADIEAKSGKTDKHGNPLQPSPEYARCIAWATRDEAGAVRQIAALGKGFDFANVVEMVPHTSGARFIACKVIEKVCKFVSAVHEQNPATATDYAVQVIYNALRNGGELHIDDVQASLSRRVQKTEKSDLSRASYTPGTANSQGSQIRMLADALRFADISKGARGDVMRIKPELMGELRDLFNLEAEGDTAE